MKQSGNFLALLKHRNNRMVWGGMIALATIADLKPKEIWDNVDTVISAVDHGTVITAVSGVKTLAKVATANEQYRQKIFPVLMKYLKTCIPRDVPTHAESMPCAIHANNQQEFLEILDSRQSEMTSSQLARLRKVKRQLG